MNIGNCISELRKIKQLTQLELADLLNVTHQAVSQWERNETYPDITVIPKLAEVFDVSIDFLFGVNENKNPELDNDESLRAVLMKGHHIIKSHTIAKEYIEENKITFEINGQVQNIESWFSVIIKGDVNGSVTAGTNVELYGDMDGNLIAGKSVTILDGDISGLVQAGSSVTCNEINGDVIAGGKLIYKKNE